MDNQVSQIIKVLSPRESAFSWLAEHRPLGMTSTNISSTATLSNSPFVGLDNVD